MYILVTGWVPSINSTYTCNDIVYVETGEPNVKTIIFDKQVKFLKKLRSRTTGYVIKAINMAIQTKSLIGRRIQYLENNPINHNMQFQSDLQTRIQNSDSTRRIQYRLINPNLKPYKPMFDFKLPELHRIAITRIRTGSHHLKIETGRWARIPTENRKCHCQTGIQDEEHVLLKCPLSKDLRQTFRINHTSLTDLYDHNIEDLAEYCYRILLLYRT